MNEPKPSSPTSPPPNWRSILLIRHGATALNSDDQTKDRIRGWGDWELSGHGGYEAVKLADKVADNTPAVLLHSDLLRAASTAWILAQILHVPVAETGKSFRPWDVGLFVGANAAETMPKLARYAVDSHKAVPGGESFDSFRTRFLSGLWMALQSHQGLIGIVTHHRCERLLKAWAKAQYPENGFVDLDEFTKKGEPTGHCEIIQVPVHRLELWRDWWKLQNMPAFGDGREETYRRYFHDSDLAMIELEEGRRK